MGFSCYCCCVERETARMQKVSPSLASQTVQRLEYFNFFFFALLPPCTTDFLVYLKSLISLWLLSPLTSHLTFFKGFTIRPTSTQKSAKHFWIYPNIVRNVLYERWRREKSWCVATVRHPINLPPNSFFLVDAPTQPHEPSALQLRKPSENENKEEKNRRRLKNEEWNFHNLHNLHALTFSRAL